MQGKPNRLQGGEGSEVGTSGRWEAQELFDVYMILCVFAIEHIIASRTGLISTVSPMMLKWDATAQHRSLTVVQAQFAGVCQAGGCGPRVDVQRKAPRGWVGEGNVVNPKAEAKKKGVKRAHKADVEEVTKRDDKSSPSSEFNDVFDVNYTIPSRRS